MVVGNHVAEVFDAVNRVGGLADGAPSDDAGGKKTTCSAALSIWCPAFSPAARGDGRFEGSQRRLPGAEPGLRLAAGERRHLNAVRRQRFAVLLLPIMLGYTAGKNSAATLRHHGDRRRVDASADDGGVRSGAAAGAVREYFFGIP